MAITETTVFDKVRIGCNCAAVRVYGITPYNNGRSAVGAESIEPTTTDDDQIAQLDIMRDAVIAGTATVEYKDSSRIIPYADLPFEHSLVHTLHSIHPEDGWKATGTLVRNADVTEDADTGRSDLSTQFGIIPAKRQPDGTTYNYPLDRWNVRLVPGSQISVARDWPLDDDITDPNTHNDVRGMFAWLEEHRVADSGTAFGDDITAIADLSGRTIRVVQGSGLDTLDLHVTSIGSNAPSGVYDHVSFSLTRISGETGTVDIDAFRALVMAAVGTITVASGDVPEETPFGSPNNTVDAERIRFPNGILLEVVGNRLMVRSPGASREPVGTGRRTVRFAELAFQDVAETVRLMPSDGRKVVHFGHDATADGTVQFEDDISKHTTSEDLADIYEVLNISYAHDCRVNAGSGGGTLINLKPGQQCNFEIAEDNADGNEEIIALDPPSRRIVWARGLALPNLGDQHVWFADSASWMALPWPTDSGLNYIDTDGFTLGTAEAADSGVVASVSVADWDIPGSFQINHPGLVHLDLEYELIFNVDPPTNLQAVLGPGHGISLWISEGGTAALIRNVFVGLAEMSAIGDRALCSLRYTGGHSENTRFLILHRIPATTSTIGTNADSTAYLDQIEMEALFSTAELDPTIRWTNS